MGQGRTDAGVHAAAQVAHIDVPDSSGQVSKEDLIRGINAFLPPDVRITDARPVPDAFHARFDAVSREYRYLVTTGGSPLLGRIAWCTHRALDIEILHQLALSLLGKHDFINFCIPQDRENATSTCTILSCSWQQWALSSPGDYLPGIQRLDRDTSVNQDSEAAELSANKAAEPRVSEGSPMIWIFSIKGDRFLRHMVRRLVGSMVQAAMISSETTTHEAEKRDKSKKMKRWQRLLNGEPCDKKGYTAPAQGLTLLRVNYDTHT